MLTVPLNALATQTLNVTLDGQPCTLDIYQKTTGLFMDVYVNGSLIIGGVACLNQARVVQNTYFGFLGDFTWVDTGASPGEAELDPYYQGIGARFFLIYLEVADLNGLG